MSEKKGRKELLLSAYMYVLSITSEMHGRYVIYFLIILFNQALSTLLTVLIGKSIDVSTGIITRFDFTDLLWMVLAVTVFRCGGAILESVFHIRKITYDIDTTIEQHNLKKLFCFSPGQTNRENTGLKMDTLQKGKGAVEEMTSLLANTIAPTSLRIVTAIGILSYINWRIGTAVFGGIFLFSVSSVWLNNGFVEPIRKARKLESDVETKFWEIIKHLRLVILTASQQKVYDKQFAEQKVAREFGKGVWTKYNIVIGVFRNLPFDHLMQAPLLALIFYLVGKQSITLGDVAIVITLISNAYSGVGNIGTVQRSLLRHSINIVRLRDMLEQPIECADIEDAIELARPQGRIQFEHVQFAYDGITNALNDISFTIEPGETVAFVGSSGSGKSTIISLLLRGHEPQSGSITVDDVPLTHVAINSWRQAVGVVSQQTMLWDSTVRDNIVFGVDRELGDEELQQIVSDSCINEFYDRLGPQGLDTMIGENGILLSGGQSQRIAIARVLARDPRVIIFDEATSALDYHTEAKVYEAMERALGTRTGIIIAHRLGTVRKANRIIVLDKGRIVGQGTFEELSQNNEAFKQLIGSELR
jgi:ATP-binding cassette subfamily B protein